MHLLSGLTSLGDKRPAASVADLEDTTVENSNIQRRRVAVNADKEVALWERMPNRLANVASSTIARLRAKLIRSKS